MVGKYEQFLTEFPSVHSLAKAPLSRVLLVWQGLGYNRRAKFIHDAAKQIVATHSGEVPSDTGLLAQLPGIGVNTAGAIAAYAFNKPVVFVETNIRTVFIHHFFARHKTVRDAQLLPLLQATLDRKNPRLWYSALMDYGFWLKRTGEKGAQKSAHYVKQKKFSGSVREARGLLVQALTVREGLSVVSAEKLVGEDRYVPALRGLIKDGLIRFDKHRLFLA